MYILTITYPFLVTVRDIYRILYFPFVQGPYCKVYDVYLWPCTCNGIICNVEYNRCITI
jgi:hypothetical protein